jgi:hypothetical protein
MLVVPPAENGRRSNATDTAVLAPKVYTSRGTRFSTSWGVLGSCRVSLALRRGALRDGF